MIQRFEWRLSCVRVRVLSDGEKMLVKPEHFYNVFSWGLPLSLDRGKCTPVTYLATPVCCCLFAPRWRNFWYEWGTGNPAVSCLRRGFWYEWGTGSPGVSKVQGVLVWVRYRESWHEWGTESPGMSEVQGVLVWVRYWESLWLWATSLCFWHKIQLTFWWRTTLMRDWPPPDERLTWPPWWETDHPDERLTTLVRDWLTTLMRDRPPWWETDWPPWWETYHPDERLTGHPDVRPTTLMKAWPPWWKTDHPDERPTTLIIDQPPWKKTTPMRDHPLLRPISGTFIKTENTMSMNPTTRTTPLLKTTVMWSFWVVSKLKGVGGGVSEWDGL